MNPFAARRARLCARMQAGSVAIVPTAPEAARNSDSDYPYRHDSYFYYLSGFTEPDSVLAMVAGVPERSILFCRQKNSEREIWDGFRHGPPAIADRADVAQHRNAAAAQLPDLGDGLKENLLLGSDVGQRKIVAAFGKANGYRAANSAACSRHDRMSGHVTFSPVVRTNCSCGAERSGASRLADREGVHGFHGLLE